MRYYNYPKAKQLIEENKENLQRASIGMAEDMFWTAQTIWEDGQWKEKLFEGDLIKEEVQYRDELAKALNGIKDGESLLKIRAEIGDKYKHILFGGICASSWATPAVLLEFKDGTKRLISCYILHGSIKEKPDTFLYGCLSGPIQDTLPELEKE